MSAIKALAATLVATSFASAAVIDVFVGGDAGLVFTPEHVTAHVGDSIRFTFGTKNHTVTQSTFADPCTLAPGGFFSGYMPVPAGKVDDLPQFWIPVKDEKPIWAFCSQGNHCQQGMVFAVNAPAPPADNSFDNWKAKAKGLAPAPVASPVASTNNGAAGAAYGSGDYGSGYGSGYGDSYGSGYGSGSEAGAGAGAAGGDAAATTTASSAAPSPTPNSAAAVSLTGVVHTIVVGGSAGLVYTPNNIQANPGDVVKFEFQVKNHTVTKSTFANPCSPATEGFFDSGFMPVDASLTSGFPTYQFTVNDTKPIWGYCKQGAHCQAGMVFAINANETSANNFAAFQAAAKGASPSASAGASGASQSTTPNGAVASNAKLGAAVVAAVALGFGVLL